MIMPLVERCGRCKIRFYNQKMTPMTDGSEWCPKCMKNAYKGSKAKVRSNSQYAQRRRLRGILRRI